MLRSLLALFLAMPVAALAAPSNTTVPPPPLTTPLGARGTPHTCGGIYPALSLRLNEQGTTMVAFTVTAQGTVADISIKRSSGFDRLDAATLACVATWTYKPATKDGVALDMPWQAQVQWKIPVPLIAAAPFVHCADIAAVTPDMLKNISGRSWIAVQLMADGSVTPMRVVFSSGNPQLDEAATRCVAKRRYDVTERVIPPQGLPEYAVVDWAQELGPAKQ